MPWPWTRRRGPRVSDALLTEFEAVTHRVARVGEHLIEFTEGQQTLTFNGQQITAAELEHVARALYQAAVAFGVLAPITA